MKCSYKAQIPVVNTGRVIAGISLIKQTGEQKLNY